jgi:hypothetical protein
MPSDIEFVELLQTVDPTEIEVVKSILKTAGIKHYFKGQALGRIFPSMNKPVRLMVEKDMLEDAKTLLEARGKQ